MNYILNNGLAMSIVVHSGQNLVYDGRMWVIFDVNGGKTPNRQGY